MAQIPPHSQPYKPAIPQPASPPEPSRPSLLAGMPALSEWLTPADHTHAADHTRVAPQGLAASLHAFLDRITGHGEAPARPEAELLGVQQRLAQLGYPLEASGQSDDATVSVLKRFQQAHGLPQSGQADAPTLEALKRAEVKHQDELAAIEKLKTMKPSELHQLGRKDPKAFFQALLPAALESERKYGVPAVMTLVQAAVESDFARSPIGGYNLFGIKGAGPAGTVELKTREVIKGKNHTVSAGFAKYHNFYEAASSHGQLFTNGYYDKAMEQYARDKDSLKFIDNIAKIYATDPHYAQALKNRIAEYDLLDLVAQARQ